MRDDLMTHVAVHNANPYVIHAEPFKANFAFEVVEGARGNDDAQPSAFRALVAGS
jgi:hypothetical protein